MRKYNFFNKRRVSVGDMNDMQDWINDNIRNYIGAHLEKGIVRDIDKKVLGSADYGFLKFPQAVAFDQTNYIATPDQGLLVDIPVVSAGIDAMYFVDAGGRLFFIQANETYVAAPTIQESNGNIGIPLSSGDGDYYVWIQNFDAEDPTYKKGDKNGTTHYPRLHETYRWAFVFNSPAQPPADVIYIGRINKVGTTLTFFDDVSNPAVTPARLYSGIKSESVNIKVDSTSPPTAYVDGTETTLKDHINALGDKTVRPENPHGVEALHTGAMDRDKFSAESRIISNGIVYDTGSDTSQELMLETARQIVKKFNSGDLPADEHYIRMERDSDYKVHYNGRVFNLNNAEPYDSGIGAVRLNFSGDGAGGGTNANEGWWRVYLEHDGSDDTAYVELKADFWGTDLPENGMPFDNVQDVGVTIGFVWWLNSGGNTELRVHAGYVGGNPEVIQPIISLGTTNTAYDKKTPRELSDSPVGKNLIPMAYFVKTSQWILTDSINNIYNHFIGINGLSTTSVSAILSGGLIWIRATNIQTNDYITLNFNTAGIPQPPLHMVLNFLINSTNYDPTVDGYIEIVEVGSGQSYFPPIKAAKNYQMSLDFNFASNVRLYFRGTWNASTTFDFSPTSCFLGLNSQNYSARGIAPISTKDIYNDYSSDELRTEIESKSLATIITNNMPMVTQIQNIGNPNEINNSGYYSGTTVDNIEMWCVRSEIVSWVGSGGKYRSDFSWNPSEYELVSVSFAAPSGEWKIPEGIGVPPNTYTSWSFWAKSSGVMAMTSHNAFSLMSGNTVFWILIMKKIS